MCERVGLSIAESLREAEMAVDSARQLLEEYLSGHRQEAKEYHRLCGEYVQIVQNSRATMEQLDRVIDRLDRNPVFQMEMAVVRAEERLVNLTSGK